VPARYRASDVRLQRLLALVPWVAAHDGPPIEEVCARFNLTPAQLAADLEIVFLVGLYPFTPDQLIEATIEDGRVWVRYAEMFARPLRLGPEEALALVAAGTTWMAVPGADPDGPLARGLAKLAAVLDIDPAEAVEVDLGAAHGPTFELLQQAVATHRQVRIDYYSFARDARSERTVDPWQVVAEQGQWYLRGYCHRANGERIFRLDRISQAGLLDGAVDHQAPPGEPVLYHGVEADPRVVIEAPAEAAWVADAYPVDRVQELGGQDGGREAGGREVDGGEVDGGEDGAAGRLRITLPVTGRAWLERLLLRLGPDARVLELDDRVGDAGVAAAAARRVLARYHG